MRPRFSLKWLLVLVTLLAMLLFALVTLPTMRANRLVAGVNDGRINPDREFWRDYPQVARIPSTTKAELMPRTWADLFMCQRRMFVSKTYLLSEIVRLPIASVQGEIKVSPTGFTRTSIRLQEELPNQVKKLAGFLNSK